MAMTAAISSHSLFLSLKSGLIRPTRQQELAAAQPAERCGRRRRAARPVKAMEAQRNWEWSRGSAAATESENVMVRCEEVGKEMENASPLAIVDKALEMFGNDIAIAFRFG